VCPEAERELGCFPDNAARTRYRWFCSRGLLTGSGVAGAGCKSIAGQRLRQAGMHRTTDGAAAIIALRCAKASSRREASSNTPHTQTRTA
jgi:hypothetical protein